MSGMYRGRTYRPRNTASVDSGRTAEVAAVMAEETEIADIQPGRKYTGPRLNSDQIAERLGLRPSYVRSIQCRIRKHLGWQAQ